MDYNVLFGVAAVCILVIIVFCVTFRISNNSVQSKRFRNLIIAMLFAAFFDTTAGLTINYHTIVPVWINILVNTIGFVSIMSAVFCYSRYIDILVHNDDKENKTMVIFNKCVYGAYLIIMTANSFLGFVFEFDSEGIYQKTELYLLVYAVPLYYLIYSSVVLIHNHKKFERKQIVAISSFCPMLLIGAILQFVFSNVLLVMFVSTLSLIVILFFLETPDYQKLNNTMLELDKARQEAIKASKAKSEFLSNMSHEIRTPINAVLGMNEMIIRETKEREIAEYAANIQSAGRTLLSIINDILDFSKIESGKMEIVPVSYDVSSLVNDIVNMVKSRAEKKKLTFIPEIDENIPSMLYGDDVRLRQIITNILTNAVKYTHTGSVKLVMKVNFIENDILRLEVSVSDTGIGIKEEDMDLLFNSFQRLDQEKNRSIEGTGLGITIVQKLLAMMNSKLNVSSVYGKGSTFSFIVEQKIVSHEPMGNYEERFKAISDNHTETERKTAPDARILVVDDNETNLLVAKNLLKKTLARIDTAGGGRECIRLLSANAYDIVFLDHMMPELDGIQTLKLIKEDNIGGNAVFIALTANAVHGARQTYLDAGFDDYLSKPFSGHDIEKCLFSHIDKSLIKTERVEEKPVQEAVTTEHEPEKNEMFDVETGMFYTGGDKASYDEILRVYVQKSPSKQELIMKLFEEKDWKNYVIEVHALKSSSLTIGAKPLSELAKELELSGKAENYEPILEKNGTLMEMYKEVCGLAKSYLGITEEDNASVAETELKEITADELNGIIGELRSACDSFDGDTIDEICKTAGNYSCNKKPLMPFLDEIKAFADDFEYDSASEKIDELIEKVKQKEHLWIKRR